MNGATASGLAAAYSRQTADAALIGMALVCAVLIPVWLFRLKSRGLSAVFMAVAFALMGALALAYRADAPMPVLIGLGVGVLLCLVGDALSRVARQARERFERGETP